MKKAIKSVLILMVGIGILGGCEKNESKTKDGVKTQNAGVKADPKNSNDNDFEISFHRFKQVKESTANEVAKSILKVLVPIPPEEGSDSTNLIMQTEVSQRQWVGLMEKVTPVMRGMGRWNDDMYPVCGVRENEFNEFLRRLNKCPLVVKEGLRFRLPTLGEWLVAYAKIGCVDRKDTRSGSFHRCELEEDKTHLYDMDDNVSELIFGHFKSDEDDTYSSAEKIGFSSALYRGGHSEKHSALKSYRGIFQNSDSWDDFNTGFRLVAVPLSKCREDVYKVHNCGSCGCIQSMLEEGTVAAYTEIEYGYIAFEIANRMVDRLRRKYGRECYKRKDLRRFIMELWSFADMMIAYHKKFLCVLDSNRATENHREIFSSEQISDDSLIFNKVMRSELDYCFQMMKIQHKEAEELLRIGSQYKSLIDEVGPNSPMDSNGEVFGFIPTVENGKVITTIEGALGHRFGMMLDKGATFSEEARFGDGTGAYILKKKIGDKGSGIDEAVLFGGAKDKRVFLIRGIHKGENPEDRVEEWVVRLCDLMGQRPSFDQKKGKYNFYLPGREKGIWIEVYVGLGGNAMLDIIDVAAFLAD